VEIAHPILLVPLSLFKVAALTLALSPEQKHSVNAATKSGCGVQSNGCSKNNPDDLGSIVRRLLRIV